MGPRGRRSGLLLHPTSLPGPFGCGDLGRGAVELLDFLAAAGQGWWQMLPVHPPGPGDSPYQAHSAFAGSPLLVDLEELVRLGLVGRSTTAELETRSRRRTDYAHAHRARSVVLEEAFDALERAEHDEARALAGELDAFERENAGWLEDWTLYAALKAEHGGRPWTDWGEALARRDEATLAQARERTTRARRRHAFAQLLFFRQWSALRHEAAARDVRLLGDLPMFVAHDSADVWANRHLFRLDERGRPTHVSGAPPDPFNAGGQVWGHPLFDWDVVEQSGWRWWIDRVRHAIRLSDVVRLDHFIGYRAAWEVPFGEHDAIGGAYGPGPGAALFHALGSALGELPFVAEDLGDVHDDVHRLRAELDIPGMRVITFGFAGQGDDPHLPHNHPTRAVCYTGTHDNDTAQGWFDSLDSGSPERRRLRAYLGHRPTSAHWDLLRLAWQSVAETAIAPVQDVLGLGSRARMNRPGTATGNWRFRLRAGELSERVAKRLRALTELTGRFAPRERAPEVDASEGESTTAAPRPPGAPAGSDAGASAPPPAGPDTATPPRSERPREVVVVPLSRTGSPGRAGAPSTS